MPDTHQPEPTADALVAEARRAVHESLTFLAAPEADRVRALIADLETAVEGRTAIRFAGPDDTDLTEPDIDRMMAAGTPVQIVTAPPDTRAANESTFASDVASAAGQNMAFAVSVPVPAPTDWIDGDPLMEAIAAAVWELCERHADGGSGLVIDDPRNIAAAAAPAAARILGRDRCIHVKAVHDAHHPGSPVNDCPWCTDRAQPQTDEEG